MFRKSLIALAAAALVSAPLASYAQSAPAPAPVVVPQVVAPQAPAAAPRGRELDGLFAVAAIVVIAGLFAHRH